MNNKVDKKLILIISALVILYAILLFLYFRKNTYNNIDMSKFTNSTTTTTTTKTTISTTTKVESSLTEYVDLHTTYYLGKLYVEENQSVSSGTKLLKYKNGKFLKAPYDCVITSMSLPNESKKITNEHYIQISSTNSLMLEFNVSESKISSLSIGDEAKITIPALDNKEYTGYITNISNTASNKRFQVTVEFINDGDIMLGMSANVEL